MRVTFLCRTRTGIYYILHSDRRDVARILLQRGVNINTRNQFGDTALHVATFHGKLKAWQICKQS